MGLCVCAPLESTDEIAEYWLQQQNAYGILASHLSLDGMWVTCNSDNNSHKSSYLVYTVLMKLIIQRQHTQLAQ